MGGLSSQVIWKQRHDGPAEDTFKRALSTLRCCMRELDSQKWDASTASIGGLRDYKCSYIAPAASEWTSILLHLNASIGAELAAELSRLASGPAILFLEYDQSTWGYVLYINGVTSDRFWSVPQNVEEDPILVRGQASVLSDTFGKPESTIAPYLRHLPTDSLETAKAFADDNSTLGDHWVRVDFMRRLGLQYPNPRAAENGRHIQIFER
jgi:hypothetical protein